MAENEKPHTNGAQHPDVSNGNPQNGNIERANGDAEKQNGHDSKAKDKDGKKDKSDKKGKDKDKGDKKDDKKEDPPGGFDATPVPSAPDGYNVKFTFHRAENLPISDLGTRSTDPYLIATLTSALRKRHEEDPDMILRTPTIHENTSPEWNYEWIVAGVPSSGFRLKCRLYDEDPSDHDDRLGNVTIHVSSIGPNWQGLGNDRFKIKKRMGSKRAYAIRGCAALFSNDVHMSGLLYVSAEVMGKSKGPHGRMYTLGSTSWIKHYSPMIGRLAGTKAPKAPGAQESTNSDEETPKTERYDFQANQFQLQGPVPEELYHRFVEFKPFVKGMFSKVGLRGRVLNKALHHQHSRVYNFSASTEYGTVPPCSEEASLQFLKMAHYDEGGRIFTYVLTLDGLLRFTETGKEFGIDMLSKHTMHSDVNIYIACSGEFFIRRLAHPDEAVDAKDQKTHPNSDLPGGPPNEPPPLNPKSYELIIDNDSGTYRPKVDLLPHLEQFLQRNFPGLHVVTMDGMDEKLDEMKEAQRERKKTEGQNMAIVQGSDDDISSSDEEALDAMQRSGGGKKKSGKQRAYEALEDPSKALKGLIPGEGSRKEREEREEEGDRAEAAGRA